MWLEVYDTGIHLTRNEAHILYWCLAKRSNKLTEKIKANSLKEKPRCMSDEFCEREALDKILPQLYRFYKKIDALKKGGQENDS